MAERMGLIAQSSRRDVDPEYWLRKLDAAKSNRSNFDTLFSETARRILPEADQFTQRRTPGERRRQYVFSSHGARALEKWVSAMLSLMVPKTEMYQRVQSSDPELNRLPEVKRFYEELTRRVFRLRNSPRADFYGCMQGTFTSLGAFGNGCFFIEEGRGVRYIKVPLSEVWIAVDHQGRVTTIFREYRMSASAADMKWRRVWGQSPPERVKMKLAEDPFNDEALTFVHVVTPRGNRDPLALGPQSMPWRSIHLGFDDRIVIDERGFDEMPFIFGRESLAQGEIYGRGPAMRALPELHTLNAMRKTVLVSSERAAAPPVLAADEGLFEGRSVNLGPDAVNRGMVNSQGRPLMLPFQSGANIAINLEMIQEESNSIDDAFGLNLFRILIEDPRQGVTATEILQRAQEKGELIAPGINARQSQMLGPTTEREIGILARMGELPEVPPVLIEAGGEYESEYIGPADRLQRSAELAAVTRTLDMVAPLVEQDPRVLLKFKASEFIDRAMEIQGGPLDILRTEEEYQELLAQMAEQEQQVQQAMQMREGAAALKDGASALSMLGGAAQGA